MKEDGTRDLVFAGPAADRVHLMEDGASTSDRFTPNGGGSRALEACARLGSAALIAEGVPGPAAGFVRVQTLDASGAFAGAPLFVARGGGAWSLAGTAEVDGDGLQDLVFEGKEGTPAEPFGKIEIAAGERAGSAIFLGLGGGTFSFAGKGDVDADGDEDLVWESGEHGALRIDLAEGADAPTPHVRASGGFSVAAVGDATGGGKADLVLEQGAAAKL